MKNNRKYPLEIDDVLQTDDIDNLFPVDNKNQVLMSILKLNNYLLSLQIV